MEFKTQELFHLLNYSESHEKVANFIFDEIKNTIMTYSYILIGLMVLVSLVEVAYLKSYVVRRKVI